MNIKKKIKSGVKSIAKALVKSLVPQSVMRQITGMRNLAYKNEGCKKHFLRYTLVLNNSSLTREDGFVRQMDVIFHKMKININTRFIYPFDSSTARALPDEYLNLTSMTPDFGKIIKTPFSEIEKSISQCRNASFKQTEVQMVMVLRSLVNRITKMMEGKRNDSISSYIPNILERAPKTMEEALQKILFFHAIFYQAQHLHIGLGRLDKILLSYYKSDVENGTLTRESAKELIKEFCRTLNRDMKTKSVALQGDTGEYILLGGIDKNNVQVDNELTALFLEVVGELKLPTPKIILRVNDQTSHDIWQKAIDCISTGCGSPLLMNETLIMKNMVRFGYRKEDVSELGTSACWEPLIIGKSFDQNNSLRSIIAVKSVNDLIKGDKDTASFDSFKEEFKKCLYAQIVAGCHDLNLDCSPLFTLFMDDCIANEKDYSEGGARYAYHGMQVLSLPNAINSLLNIKKFVFESHLFSMQECAEAINSDYQDHEDMQEAFRTNPQQFGAEDATVISLTNELLNVISEAAKQCKINGAKVKIGISSPSFVDEGSKFGATLDGRKAGAPFNVHISPLSEKVGIKEVCDFAGKINYADNMLNGNVVDFILPHAFLKDPGKLEIILKDGMHNGIFELQLNVMDVATLKDALVHPDQHRDLIVRVWGFSAYFNDLPKEYKLYLIHRAETYAA